MKPSSIAGKKRVETTSHKWLGGNVENSEGWLDKSMIRDSDLPTLHFVCCHFATTCNFLN